MGQLLQVMETNQKVYGWKHENKDEQFFWTKCSNSNENKVFLIFTSFFGQILRRSFFKWPEINVTLLFVKCKLSTSSIGKNGKWFVSHSCFIAVHDLNFSAKMDRCFCSPQFLDFEVGLVIALIWRTQKSQS